MEESNNSLIVSTKDTISKISDETLQDALNISDNESLRKTLILEEGVRMSPDQLKIDLSEYKE